MIVTALGCAHGAYDQLDLPGGDLLIITGDLTASDKDYQYFEFNKWLLKQDYKKKIVISGNHDNRMVITDKIMMPHVYCYGAEYLCNSGTEFEDLKIWGSPNSLLFDNINPRCTAFCGTEEDLAKEYAKIPYDIDILITHTPPKFILDQVNDYRAGKIINTGSKSLLDTLDRVKPRYHFFSHIHEHGGKSLIYKHMMSDKKDTLCVNCSIMNEHYKAVNKPITLEIL